MTTLDHRAALAGLATDSLYDQLRAMQSRAFTACLTGAIRERSWEAVQYTSPETGQPAIAHFESLLDWLTGNPVRGGVGARMDRLLLLLTEPIGGSEGARECLRLLAEHGVPVPSPTEQIQRLAADLDDDQLEQAIAALRLRQQQLERQSN